MSQSPTDKLYTEFPTIFTKQTSFSLPEGWHDLVYGLCIVIVNHIEYAYPIEVRTQMYASQVKEKFGTLRFYMNHEDDFISGVIAMAEYHTHQMCQQCGNKGSQHNVGGWVSTLCSKHYAKELKKIAKK